MPRLGLDPTHSGVVVRRVRRPEPAREIYAAVRASNAENPAVKAFLTVAATDGQAPLSAKGYVPLAQSLQTKVLAAIKAIS